LGSKFSSFFAFCGERERGREGIVRERECIKGRRGNWEEGECIEGSRVK